MSRALLSLFTALLLGTLVSAPLAAGAAPGHSDEPSFHTPFVDGEALPSVSSGDDSDDSGCLIRARAMPLALRPVAAPLPVPVDLTLTAERPHARAPPHHL